jgi:ribonucleotide reductase beta subunit family protein with ferritin-like domain
VHIKAPILQRIISPTLAAMDPLLHDDSPSYCLLPIRYPRLWDAYKRAEACFWTAEEVDLSGDADDWASLTDDERHFVIHVLAFFAGSDGIVNENLAARFMTDVAPPEAKAFYGFQIAMENIHSETYALLIDTYISDGDQKARMFNAVNDIPCIQRKAAWAKRWIEDKDASFATRCVAFACVEGIFFSGAFCAIFWLKERGVLPGLCFSNELISRDEALHTEFAVMLHGMLQPRNQLTEGDARAMILDAVAIEKTFIIDALPCRMLGMNADMMGTYIEFVADRLLLQLGFDAAFSAKNPFPFMERISLTNKTNFFEARVSEYARSGVCAELAAGAGGPDCEDDDF